MASQWFYRAGTQEVGPVSSAQIRALVSDGTITPETALRKDDSNWMKASRIKGLFGETVAEPENELDPLVAMGARAASSVANAAGSAASAIGGMFRKK